jgi:hypothetical protein
MGVVIAGTEILAMSAEYFYGSSRVCIMTGRLEFVAENPGMATTDAAVVTGPEEQLDHKGVLC